MNNDNLIWLQHDACCNISNGDTSQAYTSRCEVAVYMNNALICEDQGAKNKHKAQHSMVSHYDLS